MNKRVKLLFVDDEPINLMLFETCFGDSYSVITATSGDEGLTVLANQTGISIVFTDMKMPGMNGVEFAQKAKAMYPEISFFILTGYGLTDPIKEAIDAKIIVDCLFKPFDIEEVERAITNLTESNISL
jgi:response regulator RpfG family c-di-GMP phosphodiesterase